MLGALWGYLALKETSTRRGGEKFDPLGAVSFQPEPDLPAACAHPGHRVQLDLLADPDVVCSVRRFPGILPSGGNGTRKNPVIDFSLFKNRIYNFSVLSAMMQSLALFAVNFLIVFYLQAVRGFDPLKAALLLIPLPLVTSVMAPLSGWIADRIGARLPATIGLLIQAAALVWFSRITATTPYPADRCRPGRDGLWRRAVLSAQHQRGHECQPNAAPGRASATLATLRQAGMVTSFALSLAVAAGSLPKEVMMQLFVGTNVSLGSQIMQDFVLGMHSAFLVSVVLCLVAATISMVRGKEDRRSTQTVQAGQMKPVK